MRVLCLHPAASSALQFSHELHKLEERLWNKHGIELVFIDGPLLDTTNTNTDDDDNDDDGSKNHTSPDFDNDVSNDNVGVGSNLTEHGDEVPVSRRWYVAESLPFTRRKILPEDSSALLSSHKIIRYLGLDASLLHLNQIWSRGGANNITTSNDNNVVVGACLPFQGVLGYGQGADVAALLPMLQYQQYHDEDTSSSFMMTSSSSLFEGLQFVILIDGKDILNDDGSSNGDVLEDDNDAYVGHDGIDSLHIILVDESEHHDESDNSAERISTSNEQLARRFGPNATIHYCKRQSCDSRTSSTIESSSAILSSSALSNIIGKFLVTQKNKLYSNSTSREIMILKHQLLNVEQLATIAISEEIQRNPPNALMAVIGPSTLISAASSGNHEKENDSIVRSADLHHEERREVIKVIDKAVGAWKGAKRREFGEEGGGAPCPHEFLLREDERGNGSQQHAFLVARADGNVDDESNDKGNSIIDDDDTDEIPLLKNLDEDTDNPLQQYIQACKTTTKCNYSLPPVPVTILTGFLGSGKSTLLRHILTSSAHRKRIAVIENEFGGGDSIVGNDIDASRLSIETMIVKDGTDGSSLADFIELPNGCVCCTVKDSLIETLEALLAKRSDLDYIIIEASGMADPGPVASIFWLDEALNSRIRLDGIVACVDAKNISFQLNSTSSSTGGGGGDEAARQIAFADRIIVNKVDLLKNHPEGSENETEIELVIREVQGINPTAPIKATTYSNIEDLDWILDINCFDAERAKDVESAFQLVVHGDTKKAAVCLVETSAKTDDRKEYKYRCCSGRLLPNNVCGLCGTHPQDHIHTTAVGTIALFGYGSVDLHKVHSWLASILWPNQDESDRILRKRLESSFVKPHESEQQTKSDLQLKQLIYRVKGILSVRHAIDEIGDIIPASNDWVDDGIVAGDVDTASGVDKRRFILQAVHDLWDIFPASLNYWCETEIPCCKIIVIGKYLEREALQEGFNACFNNY